MTTAVDPASTTAEDAISTCIRARDYGFQYEGADGQQLHGITLHVAVGERVAIMGATGVGKTTLAMSLNGLVPHHHDGEVEGELTVLERPVAESRITDLVRNVGLVMQDPESQITGQRVLDDAAVGPANLGLPKAEVFTRARAALDRVGMAELEDRDTAHMSGGQQQRLAIAGILAMTPRVVVLDEPTSELDPAGAEQVFDVVRSLSEGDQTVLLVTHEPELVVEWADRLVVLTDGHVIHDGPPETFFANAELVEAASLRAPGAAAAVSALHGAGLVKIPTTPVTLAGAVEVLRPQLPQRAVASSTPTSPPAAPEVGAIVVRTRQLGHRYPSGVEALADVSVDVHEGEFIALLGRNGAGKTTFARHLNGLLRPTSGSVEVFGQPTGDRPLHDLATQVGYVFQNPDHQIFAASVFDEVAFGLRNQNRDEDDVEARVRAVVDRVGMSEYLHTHPYRLGKGQRQRLAVASVLALEPSVLVIDEPTTGQDWHGSIAMMALVRSLNESGHTIIMITHDMALAARYAQRSLVFDGGSLVADRPVRDLFADEDLLRRTQLRPPQITELAMRLGLAPVTSTDELIQAWRALS